MFYYIKSNDSELYINLDDIVAIGMKDKDSTLMIMTTNDTVSLKLSGKEMYKYHDLAKALFNHRGMYNVGIDDLR